MKCVATYQSNGRFEIDAADMEDFKPKHGEKFVIDIARRRHVKHHQKGIMLLRAMHENQDKFEDITFTKFRKWVTAKAGYTTSYFVGNREYVEIDSLAFSKMDQTTFEEVYQGLITVAVEELGQEWATTFS